MNKTELLVQKEYLQDQLRQVEAKLTSPPEIDWSTIPEGALVYTWDEIERGPPVCRFNRINPIAGTPYPFTAEGVRWKHAKPAPQQIIIHTDGGVCPLHSDQWVEVWGRDGNRTVGRAGKFMWETVAAYRVRVRT